MFFALHTTSSIILTIDSKKKDGTGCNARDRAPNEEKDTGLSNVLKLHLLAGGDINGRRNDIDGQISLYERGIGGKTNSSVMKALRFAGGDLSRFWRIFLF